MSSAIVGILADRSWETLELEEWLTRLREEKSRGERLGLLGAHGLRCLNTITLLLWRSRSRQIFLIFPLDIPRCTGLVFGYHSGVVAMYEVLTRTDRRSRRGHHVHDDGAVVTHTGLSVITRGYMIDVVRDTAAKVAVVRVVAVDADHPPPQVDQQDLKVAADTFAERVIRYLGSEWNVVRWEPQVNEAQPNRVAGYISEPWRTGA